MNPVVNVVNNQAVIVQPAQSQTGHLQERPAREMGQPSAIVFGRIEQKLAMDVDRSSDRIFQELNTLTADIYASVYQAKARLLDMLQQEVQTLFAEILTKEDAWRIPTLADAQVAAPPRQASVLAPAKETLPATSPALSAVPQPPTSQPSRLSPPQEVAAQPPLAETAQEQTAPFPTTCTMYEGAVGLKVMSSGWGKQTLQFVHDLCQMPQLNLKRLLRDEEEIDVGVILREPLDLIQVLSQIKSVRKIEAVASVSAQEPAFVIWLEEDLQSA